MRINHNISALKINNILAKNNTNLDKSLERLSSGYRINCAADDAAGLAISEKMKTQIAGLNQASRNASDGISVIQTAEGALIEVEEMLQRMRELSVQAANGSYTDEDRSTLQDEVSQLMQEINRVSETTEFNKKTLLNGTLDRRSYSSEADVSLVSLSDNVDVKSYSLNIGDHATQASLHKNITSSLAPSDGQIYINDQTIDITAGDSLDDILTKINLGTGSDIYVGYSNDTADATELGGYEIISPAEAAADPSHAFITIVNQDYGKDSKLDVSCSNADLALMLGISPAGDKSTGTDASVALYYYGEGDGSGGTDLNSDGEITPDEIPYGESGFLKTASVSVDGDYVTVRDRDNFEMVFRVANNYMGDVTVSVLDAGPMTLQIGANEGQTMEVRIPKVDTISLKISTADISTRTGAEEAITLFDNAVIQVSSIRAKLGAYENRLDHAINSLDTSAENLTEALSRIEDTDMASEMATYTQLQVLVQAATSMLSQANERPQNILNLLQS